MRRCRGITLVELLFAVALAAIVTAGLGSLTGLLLQTQTHSHASHELANQARFALNRVVATVRIGSAATSSASAPQLVVTVGARTLSYAYNAATSQLSETDSASGATSVIATNVSAFGATLATRIAAPAGYTAPLTSGGALAVPVAQVNLTLAGNGLSLPAGAWARVGGGL
jgi:Tfp pilus assembly protein FimT